MFGYVRPLKGEMKVREFEQFKACYCALCHTLKRRYGTAARFILNYDFTFLAMLLSEEESPSYEYNRCISGLRKKCCVCQNGALDRAADCSVILSYWKLKDSVSDESFFKALPSRFALLFIKGAYKKAAGRCASFDELVETRLSELSRLEREESRSIDMAADKFSKILAVAAGEISDESKKRAMEQLLYHTGRWIYILDAFDDLGEDIEAGRYNPLASRFELVDGQLSGDDFEYLQTTLSHGASLIGAAYELLPETAWSPILQNIIYLGLPYVTGRVLDRTWNKADNRRVQI